MLDRKNQPSIYPVSNINFVSPKVSKIGNVSFVEFKGGDKDVIRLRVIFNAGTKSNENPVIPVAVNALLKEGTNNYSAQELADKLDYYGAFLHAEIDKDRSWIELYCLTKHFASVLPYFSSIVKEAKISEEEWEIYKTNAIQQLKLNNEKVSFLAKSNMQAILFEGHPYGTVVTEDFYQKVEVTDLQSFFKSNIQNKIVAVEMVGQYSENEKALLNDSLDLKNGDQVVANTDRNMPPFQPKKINVPKESAVQCAISIATRFPGRKHPDYFGVKVLVCALGGYFGSRLMANIREDKGYTYGIGAGLGSYEEQSVISISTEVGVEVKKDALKEIYFEINRLREELISENELALVQNYMKGSLLKQCDGLFSQADLWNILMPFNLTFEHINEYIRVIDSITPAELKNLAKTYLDPNNFVEVVAGGNN